MDRRTFIQGTAALTVSAGLPYKAFAQARAFAPKPGAWRTVDLVTRIEIDVTVRQRSRLVQIRRDQMDRQRGDRHARPRPEIRRRNAACDLAGR